MYAGHEKSVCINFIHTKAMNYNKISPIFPVDGASLMQFSAKLYISPIYKNSSFLDSVEISNVFIVN